MLCAQVAAAKNQRRSAPPPALLPPVSPALLPSLLIASCPHPLLSFLQVGGAELYRNTELDPEKRIYPGGVFDPLKLASDDSDRTRQLREAEIKHGRLAMVAFFGFGVQALTTGEGALGSLAKFSSSF